MRRDHGEGRAPDAARGRGRSRIHADVAAAVEVVRGRLLRTPLLSSETLGKVFGGRAYLKAELFQKTGSFKARGVLTKLASLSAAEKARGVISISAGNHAQALAWACAGAGIDCLVVMWQGASEAKIRATQGYGAAVDLDAPGPVEAFARVTELRESTGRSFVHAFDDPLIIAGHGTVGLEIRDDVPDVEVVVVPTGGGGLVSGIAAALPGVRVVAAEPELSPALHEALARGEPVAVQPRSIADGLSAPFAGQHVLALCRERGVESVLVSEDDIRAAFRFLYERAKLAVEPAGAVGVAALLAGKVAELDGRTVVAVVSGGNVVAETVAAILREE